MTVGELIEKLKKYDEKQRVTINQDDIIGCYEKEICDENDNVVEKVISVYAH